MTIEANGAGRDGKKTKLFLTIGLVLSILIFLIDLQTPLGIADGVSYVAVVLLTIWIPNRRYVYYAAILGIGLTIAGFFLSPHGERMGIVIPNRILAIIGIIAAALIILSYKKAQAVALKTKEQLEALFLHANEGILIIDSSGSIVLANPRSAALFDYTTAELSGKSVFEIIPDSTGMDFQSGGAHKVMLNSGEGNQQGKGKKKNSLEFPIEVSSSHYQTDEGIFTVAFVMDITRRKKQEMELLKIHHDLELSAEELKRSNAELENFAYISSHDLQEPLRKIQSFGYRLKEMESAKISEQSNDYLNRMLNAAFRMQNLINDLLLFSRVSSRSGAYAPVDLQQILDDVMLDMEVNIEQNNAKIESFLDSATIEAEPTQMRQLFQNLLGNAIKFKKENVSPIIKIRTETVLLPESKGKKFLVIYFEDNGIGFDEKYTDRIFNIFQRLEGGKYPGSGIGLTICRKIVQRHGGVISVKSEIGKGTTFIVTLPFVQMESDIGELIHKNNSHEKQADQVN